MPARSPRASKLKSVNGKLVSAKSKTGDPKCSKAMSDWKKTPKGGTVPAGVFAILGKCRAMARQNRTAEKQQTSGKMAPGRGTWQRSDRARQLVAQRAEARPKADPKASAKAAKDAERAQKADAREKAKAAAQALREEKAAAKAAAKATRDEHRAQEKTGRAAKVGRDAREKADIKGLGAPKLDHKNAAKLPPLDRARALRDRLDERGATLHARADAHEKEAKRAERDRQAAVTTEPRKAGQLNRYRKYTEAEAAKLRDRGRKTEERRDKIGEALANRQRAANAADTPEAFAAKVNAGIAGVPASGRFANDPTGRAFIGDLYEHMAAKDPGIRAMGLAGFKAKLLEANAVGRVEMARLDMPQGVDPKRIADSHTKFYNADFHLVREGRKPTAKLAAPKADASKADAARSIAAKVKGIMQRLKPKPKAGGFALDGKAEAPAWKTAEFFNTPTKSQKGRVPLFDDDMPADSLPGQTSMFSRSSDARNGGQPIRDRPKYGASFEPAGKASASELAAQIRADKLAGRDPAKRAKKAARLKQMRADAAKANVDPESHADHAPGHVGKVPAAALNVDPDRFQYKMAPGTGGATGSLAGVKKWDDNLGGVVQVWKDPANGKTYVVNGHNRAHLAKTMGVDKLAVRYVGAKDAGQAKAIGALTNIAEGRGNAVDAAKFFRETTLSRQDLEARGIPMREKIATDGIALANLEKGLFNKAVQGEIPQERAVIIGNSGLGHDEQKALMKLVEKRPKNMPISNGTLRELADEVRHAPTATKRTASLFGDDEETINLAVQKAALTDHVKQRLGSDKKLFGTVAKSKAAEKLTAAGNSIDTAKSGAISREAAEALDVFDRLKRVNGPIASELNAAAARLHAGEPSKKVYSDVYAKILASIPKAQRL
jgi:hypothetical protein